MSETLDVISCFVVACILFPLGVWGRGSADDLVAPAVLGEDREHRTTVLRRGAMTCQVLAVVFAAVGFLLLVVG